MTRSRTDRLLCRANAMDILVYVHRNPGCHKTMVYREVTRNVHSSERLQELVDEGLMVFEGCGRVTLLRLTDTGERIAEHIVAIRRLLDDDP